MASGISHVLFMKHLNDYLPDDTELKMYLDMGRDFLQTGAVGPDLPYASLMDDDLFFTNDNDLADKFHYEKTTDIALSVLPQIKALQNNDEKIYAFCFFLGLVSHVVADGVVHPFVRDKVGNYKGNEKEHRMLEMNLDVLLFHYLMKGTGAGTNFNNSDLHEEIKNLATDFYPEADNVLKMFSDKIKEVYKDEEFDADYSVNEIKGWIKGLYRMFKIAEGEHHPLYDLGPLKSFLFEDLEDLKGKEEELLTLKVPIDRDINFLRRESINFFDDVIPQFYKFFIPLAKMIFDYIFNDGPEVTENELAAVNLDTGRPLEDGENLSLTPTYWS